MSRHRNAVTTVSRGQTPGSARQPRKRIGRELRPRWDGSRLWWGRRIAREFRRCAPEEMLLLEECLRLGWTAVMDVSRLSDRRSAQWLQDTGRNLKRGLKWIRLRVDSKGWTLRWDPVGSRSTNNYT
jgi:hypothetical protein